LSKIPPRELELEEESARKQGAEQSWERGRSGPDTPGPNDFLGLEVGGREEEEEALLLPALSSQFCAGGERKDT